ncbi:MAG: hypothetical protein ACJ8HI_11630 [Massilia sp.]
MKIFLQLCAALVCSVSTAAHAVGFVEVKTATGCALTVIPIQQDASTYAWDGECVNGKAEGMGTVVQKLRVNETSSNLYYSTQTRHAGVAFGYMANNATGIDPSIEVPERVYFQFDGTKISFTKGWGWSLDGLLVGGKSMSLPKPAPAALFSSMTIESPTSILILLASTCATDVDQTPACKDTSEPYRTIYLIREYALDKNASKRRATTPCPELFNIASCQPLLAQKSAPLRAEIVAFLERAKPSVDALLDQVQASRPNQRPVAAATRLPPPLAHAGVAQVAPGIVDAPLPVFDTKVPFPSRLGGMLWLDANTLAVTTSMYGEFWNGTTVAVDVAARNTAVILAHGFLNCSNDGLVAVTKGSLARQFAPDFLKAGAPDPVNVFYRWNARSKQLESEEPESKPTWSWHICAQTKAEDIRRAAISYGDRNLRYLKARDGVLQWKAPASRDDAPAVFLAKPGSAAIPVDVAASDIALAPKYLAFTDQYLLAPGVFLTRGAIDHKGKMVNQLPAITMTRGGTVTRQMLPASLKAALDRDTLGGGGATQPTAAGLLINYDGRPAQGGGLYLSQAGAITRIWCLPTARHGKDCALERLEVSPDGCHVAFVPRNDASVTVKIIRLCASAREPDR